MNPHACEKRKPLGIRDWLELGQALRDLCRTGPKYFRADHTMQIRIAYPKGIRAGGKRFGMGTYYLDRNIRP